MWTVTRRVRFRKRELFTGVFSAHGDSPLGLDGGAGHRLILGPARSWMGCFGEEKGRLAWAAGPKNRARGPLYIPADLKRPSWAAPRREGGFLVCNAGKGSLGILDPAEGWQEIADLRKAGLSYPANSVIDSLGNIWVNDVYRAALWVFSGSGKLLRIIGDPDTPVDGGATPVRDSLPASGGAPEAAAAAAPLGEAGLSAIWDVRAGRDGLIYILEGAMLRIRAIDFQRGTIFHVAGSGMHGHTGDGGDPRRAAFGRSGTGRWDGPLAFCLDDRGRIFIADTKNGLIRMIDEERTLITTIAGRRPAGGAATGPTLMRSLAGVLARHGGRKPDAGPLPGSDPLLLSLPAVFWLDWSSRGLSISDTDGDVTVIRETVA